MDLKTARAAVAHIVGRLHVGASEQEVREYVQSRFTKGGWKRHGDILTKAAYAEHAENRQVYSDVMGGRLRHRYPKNEAGR